jgi:lipoprotein signal peptidase
MMLHAFNNAVSFGLTKGLPWWGTLLLILGSVVATLAVALLVVRLWRPAPAPA